MKQLLSWAVEMSRQSIAILTGSVIAAALAIEPYFQPASRWVALAALLAALLWAAFRVWRQQSDRSVHLQELLADAWVRRMEKLRHELSASASLEWASEREEENYYVSKCDDDETARLAFRRWKMKCEKS